MPRPTNTYEYACYSPTNVAVQGSVVALSLTQPATSQCVPPPGYVPEHWGTAAHYGSVGHCPSIGPGWHIFGVNWQPATGGDAAAKPGADVTYRMTFYYDLLRRK
jgi:hypothetical protein